MDSPPQYIPPPPDPALALLTQQAQTQNIQSIQSQVTGDTSKIMQQYGAQMAFAGKS